MSGNIRPMSLASVGANCCVGLDFASVAEASIGDLGSPQKAFGQVGLHAIVGAATVLAVGLVGMIAAAPAAAQITSDGTLGGESSSVRGEEVEIRGGPAVLIEGGVTRGSNLFHSFSEFNVVAGQRLYFDNPSGIANILSRVTGGSVSNINGLLGVNGAANLFLLNPNGILFGPNASLDVGGSFTASTANSILFPGGSEFSATNPGDVALLSVAVPLGVQYGPSGLGEIRNNGQLFVGQNLSLAGGSIINAGALTSSDGGNINVAANSSFTLAEGAVLNASTIENRDAGSIIINANGEVVLSGYIFNNIESGGVGSAGGVFIETGSFSLINGGQIQSLVRGAGANSSAGEGNAGSVNIRANEVLITGTSQEGGVPTGIFTTLSAGANGKSGDINITSASSFNLTNGALLNGTGESFGSTTIRAENIILNNINFPDPTALVSEAQTGNFVLEALNSITINATSLRFPASDGLVAFLADSDRNGIGSFTLNQESTISTGGRDLIISGDSVNIFGTTQSTTISTSRLLLDGRPDNTVFSGDVKIHARAINFQQGDIETFSNLADPSGSIIINGVTTNNPAELVTLTDFDLLTGNVGQFVRESGDINISTNEFKLQNSGFFTGSDRKAGNVIINSPRISLIDSFFGSIVEGQDDPASSVFINWETEANPLPLPSNSVMILENGSEINLPSASGTGQAGSIRINIGRLTITDSSVVTSTISQGNGGNITIGAPSNPVSSVELTNSQINSRTGDTSATTRRGINNSSSGDGGDIRLNANSLSLNSGSRIQAQTNSPGNAGNVFITADLIGISGANNSGVNSGIQVSSEVNPVDEDGNPIFDYPRDEQGNSIPNTEATEPVLTGSGGSIIINSQDNPRGTLHISEGGFLSALTRSDSPGGRIETNVSNLVIDSGGQIISTATSSSSSRSGDIAIRATDSVTISGIDPNPSSPSSLNESDQNSLSNPNLLDGGIARSGLFAQSEGTGEAGNLVIETGELLIWDRALATVSSNTQAGSMTISANSIELNNGELVAIARRGNLGNIIINLSGPLLQLYNNSLISAGAEDQGSGGNLIINADNGFIIADPFSNSDILADAFEGIGGNITITTNALFGIESRNPVTSLSDINAASQFNFNGTITLNTLGIDPTEALTELPTDTVNAADLVASGCLGRNPGREQHRSAGRAQGEFTQTGRGGLSPSPSGILTAETALDGLNTLDPSTAPSRADPLPNTSAPEALIEAQGLAPNASGNVSLVATSPTLTSTPSIAVASTCPAP